jgi:FtsH-binding integral membrane protein
MLQEQEHSPLRREAVIAAEAPPEARRDFIKKTYAHLGVAILAFVGLEYLLLHSPFAPRMIEITLIRGGRFGWLMVLGGFMLVAWIAERWARSGASPGMQYLGLALYVVAEAIIFIPLLFLAAFYARYEGLLGTAALITGVVFTGLTAIVFLTKADFSWMRQLLYVAGLAAMGVLVASLIFGFSLGTVFSGAIVLLASGYILYHTSNVLHHYPIGSHVAAALALFASVALLFWYILRILMSRR